MTRNLLQVIYESMFISTYFENGVNNIDKEVFEFDMEINGFKIIFQKNLIFVYDKNKENLLTVINILNQKGNFNSFSVSNLNSIHLN
jgi:hypothetical protein